MDAETISVDGGDGDKEDDKGDDDVAVERRCDGAPSSSLLGGDVVSSPVADDGVSDEGDGFDGMMLLNK